MRKLSHLQIIAAAILVALFVLGTLSGSEWRTEPRLFLYVVAVPGVILSLIYLLRSFAVAPPAQPTRDSSATVTNTDKRETISREVGLIPWMVGYALAVWLFGAIVSSALFVILYLRLASKQSWFITVGAAAGIILVVWGLFQELFFLTLPRAEITYWLPPEISRWLPM